MWKILSPRSSIDELTSKLMNLGQELPITKSKTRNFPMKTWETAIFNAHNYKFPSSISFLETIHMRRNIEQLVRMEGTPEKIFNNFVLRYGFPKTLHHDQGGEFETSCFSGWRSCQVCKRHGRPRIIHKVMEKLNDSIGQLSTCWRCRVRKRQDGKIIWISIPSIAPSA